MTDDAPIHGRGVLRGLARRRKRQIANGHLHPCEICGRPAATSQTDAFTGGRRPPLCSTMCNNEHERRARKATV